MNHAGAVVAKGAAPRPPILGAAVATAIALAILVSLGVWQLHRLRWKNALIARIDAAETAAPVPLGTATPPLFTRVEAHGTLRPARALYGVEIRGDIMGARAVQILERPGLTPLVVVLGWIPTGPRMPSPSNGRADIAGYIRLPEHAGWLSAADDVQGRRFYTLDPAAIGAALGAHDVAPFTLVTGTDLPRPVNNHLQYAWTWFGLAASLAGVFCAWVFRREAARVS